MRPSSVTDCSRPVPPAARHVRARASSRATRECSQSSVSLALRVTNHAQHHPLRVCTRPAAMTAVSTKLRLSSMELLIE